MSDESSEESDDPLYGEDSSLTEGESSDEYSSGELRRRVVCSGSSSSTDLDSSSTSESYDEDDSDPEDIKFNSGSIRKKSSGFKTTPENIKTFLKADPVLNGSEIIRGSQKLDFSSKNLGFKGGPGKKKSFEWSTSESSEEDLGTKSGLKQSRSQVDEPKKSNEPNDLTIAFSVQETMRAAALSKMEKEEKSEKEIDQPTRKEIVLDIRHIRPVPKSELGPVKKKKLRKQLLMMLANS